jgi:hypothetical protein
MDIILFDQKDSITIEDETYEVMSSIGLGKVKSLTGRFEKIKPKYNILHKILENRE